jgi:hypothetical protein
MVLWLAVQIAALAVAAFHIPLWAQAPANGELQALKLLGVVQIGVSSLVFPFLMRNWRQSAMVLAATWPFIALAGLLSAEDIRTIGYLAAFVMTWLVVLIVLRTALRTTTQKMIAVAAVSLWSLGGLLIWYFREEFGSETTSGFIALGPIVEVAADSLEHNISAWIGLGAMLAVAVLLLAGIKFFQSSRRIRTTA